MRGALGDFVRFHIFSSWNVLQLQTLEAFFHLSMCNTPGIGLTPQASVYLAMLPH
jgi:hypothetical protein